MRKSDVNLYGKLTFAEFMVFYDVVLERLDELNLIRHRFAALDSNHNGFLEKQELDVLIGELIDSYKYKGTAGKSVL